MSISSNFYHVLLDVDEFSDLFAPAYNIPGEKSFILLAYPDLLACLGRLQDLPDPEKLDFVAVLSKEGAKNNIIMTFQLFDDIGLSFSELKQIGSGLEENFGILLPRLTMLVVFKDVVELGGRKIFLLPDCLYNGKLQRVVKNDFDVDDFVAFELNHMTISF
ncbi:MAG: hypothetical protein HQL69_17050 [Magnetococcales bacterium]|nr:hypothetical protein [Magnetococcales bacterium]